ncbi:hypothetical protein [Pseudolactococcus hodotermopsidis]|nr:hypothetical protein [Lactococcus hodotermopsidis]
MKKIIASTLVTAVISVGTIMIVRQTNKRQTSVKLDKVWYI